MKPTESISTALLVAVLACTVIATPATAAQFDTTAQEDGVEIVVEAQTSDTITVVLTSSANDVAGLETNMTFNSEVVRLKSIEGVDLAEPITDHSNENGWAFITQAQASGVDEPTMTRLTFEIVSEGTMALSFVSEETDVFNSEGQEIPIVTTNANVDVSTDDGSDDAGGDGGDASDTDGGDDTDGTDGDAGDADKTGDTDGETDAGDSDTGETSENSDGDETNAGDSDSGGTSDEKSDDTGDETDDESPDNEATAGSSSMISGIGLLAVVAGFLFAIAVAAREQL